MKQNIIRLFVVFSFVARVSAEEFDGVDVNAGNIFRLSKAQTRSISGENLTGEKGKAGMATDGTGKNAARELGQGWKVSPAIRIEPKKTFTLGEIAGPGVIQHIWICPTGPWRRYILRFYWDDETEPSIECPVGDFFTSGWADRGQNNSLMVNVNPGSGLNCYWPMPFRKRARVTLENLDDKPVRIFYQIDYALTKIPKDAAYLHAQFRRENPLRQKGIYTILDGVKGRGHYVGTYMAYEARSPGWWGEGEIKFYMDGDKEFPTICGTGTEDYFLGSYNFENRATKLYQLFSAPYAGLTQVIPAETAYVPPQRFSLYRWHVPDPIRFEKDLRVTIQSLGWQSGGRYLQQEDDIATVAFWYQTEPHAKFPALPDSAVLDITPLPKPQPKKP